jgi:hypothetical protein
VDQWLYACLRSLRGARVLVECPELSSRSNFLRQVANAISAFARLPAETRLLGVDALNVQSSLRKLLAASNSLFVNPNAPFTSSSVRFYSFDRAAKELVGANELVVGISLNLVNEPLAPAFSKKDRFHRTCLYKPASPACNLPPIPSAPTTPTMPRPPIVTLDSSPEVEVDDEKGTGFQGLNLLRAEDVDDEKGNKEQQQQEEGGDNNNNNDAFETFFSKCPICLEIPLPPWKTTTCGHLICEDCHARLPNRRICPTCRAVCEQTLVPQFLLAEVAKANRAMLRCRHDSCGRRIQWDMARAHHETCEHRPQECLLKSICPSTAKCDWKGPRGAHIRHFITDHGVLERTEHQLTLRESDLGHLIVWVPGHALVKVDRSANARTMSVALTSLTQSPLGDLLLSVRIGRTYKAAVSVNVAYYTFKHYFPDQDPKLGFSIAMNPTKKRAREEAKPESEGEAEAEAEAEAEGHEAKVARKEPNDGLPPPAAAVVVVNE